MPTPLRAALAMTVLLCAAACDRQPPPAAAFGDVVLTPPASWTRPVLVPAHNPAIPATPEPAPERPGVSCDFVTAGTFGGRPIAAALQALSFGKVVNIIPSQKSGRTVKVTLLLEPDWRVFFKPRHRVHLFTRPEGEVGAFRINRLLGMNHVPPAVVRTFNGSVFHSAFKRYASADRLDQLEREVLLSATDEMIGAALLWIDDASDYEPPPSLMRRMGRPDSNFSPQEQSLVWDLTWMLVLDHLTNNYDRFTGGNILRRKDGRLMFIDNGAAFGPDREWKAARRKSRLGSLSMHSPALTRALLRLEPRVMASCAGDVFTARDIEDVLFRRDQLLSHLRELEKRCPVDCRLPRELEAP